MTCAEIDSHYERYVTGHIAKTRSRLACILNHGDNVNGHAMQVWNIVIRCQTVAWQAALFTICSLTLQPSCPPLSQVCLPHQLVMSRIGLLLLLLQSVFLVEQTSCPCIALSGHLVTQKHPVLAQTCLEPDHHHWIAVYMHGFKLLAWHCE